MILSKLFSTWLRMFAKLADLCSKKEESKPEVKTMETETTENTIVVDPVQQARAEFDTFVAAKHEFIQARLREGSSPRMAEDRFLEQCEKLQARVLAALEGKHAAQPGRSVIQGPPERRYNRYNPCCARILEMKHPGAHKTAR